MAGHDRLTDEELYEWAYRHKIETTSAGPAACHAFASQAVYHRRPDKMRAEVDRQRAADETETCEHPRDFTAWCARCRPSDGAIQTEVRRLRAELRRAKRRLEDAASLAEEDADGGEVLG